ncbi:hypothetical protein WA026_009886, partial [Henosepilachna vigintioctopunctata]
MRGQYVFLKRLLEKTDGHHFSFFPKLIFTFPDSLGAVEKEQTCLVIIKGRQPQIENLSFAQPEIELPMN